MKFVLTIQMDNAAFDHPDELSAILQRLAFQWQVREAAQRKEGAPIAGFVRDSNGNRVGEWRVETDAVCTCGTRDEHRAGCEAFR